MGDCFTFEELFVTFLPYAEFITLHIVDSAASIGMFEYVLHFLYVDTPVGEAFCYVGESA